MATYRRFPVTLTRGAGCRVWDDAGRSYLDFAAGIATCTLGHAHPALVAAVQRQISRLHHVSNLYNIAEQTALATWLCQHSHGDRVFFCNSGAEANEAAIKLARKHAYTRRGASKAVIVCCDGGFHGRTLATITATGQPRYQANFGPMVPGFVHVPFNDLAAMKSAVAAAYARGDTVAAVLLEPLQGEGGVRVGDPAYFAGLRQLCDDHEILVICDEVQIGVGRSGAWWGHDRLGIVPDVFTVAKGLGGGVPIGAMVCRQHCDVFEPGDHGSTFGGNPLACAAALAVVETIERDELLANAGARGEQLQTGLRRLAERLRGPLVDVRGWGLLVGVELGPDESRTALELATAALAEGLLVVPAGPRVLRFVPPLIVRADEVDEAVASFGRLFD